MCEFKIAGRNTGEIWFKALELVMAEGTPVGNTFEVGPVMMSAARPRERLISFRHGGSNPIYPYIEGLWILLGEETPDRIMHYSRFPMRFVNPRTKVLDGAYGPRLIGRFNSEAARRAYVVPFPNQLDMCYRRLNEDPDTRRAVCVINNPIYDQIDSSLDVPCTMSFQFLNRGGLLDMIVFMRSNDLVKGYPNDTCEFQWFQEILAGWLGLEVGAYHHIVGSLHVYEKDFRLIRELVSYDKSFSLYDHLPIVPLDARLNKADFSKALLQLETWETRFRWKPDKWVKALEGREILGIDNEFYFRLIASIIAYNLNKAGHLELAYNLVRDGRTDIEYVLKDKWKDIIE